MMVELKALFHISGVYVNTTEDVKLVVQPWQQLTMWPVQVISNSPLHFVMCTFNKIWAT